MEALKETLKDEKIDTKVLKEKTDLLIQDSMKLGEIMYKEAQEKAAKESKETADKNQSGKGKDKKKQGKKDQDVMDADFEDVTEKKTKKDDGDKKEKSA